MCRKLTLSNWIVLLVCLVLTGVVSAATVNNPMTEVLEANDYDINDVDTLYADDIVTKGPWADVLAYDSFSDAISGIGANEKTLLIASSESVTTVETVPSNITLYFLNGGKLNISEGNSVTVNGQIEAGLYQIFTGDGSVSFGEDYAVMGSIDAYPQNPPITVYPQWWGADGDDSADDTDALQDAFNSIGDGQKIVIPPGMYEFNDTLQFEADYGILECEGTLVWTEAVTDNNKPAVLIGGDTDADDNNVLSADISLDLVDGTGTWANDGIGVLLSGVMKCKIAIERCRSFRTGLQLGDENGSVGLNQFTLGDMRQNKIGIDVNCTNGKWVNGNKFYGGSFSYWDPNDETDFNDTRYVNIPYPTTGDDSNDIHNPDNNIFYSTCFESLRDPCEARPEYFVYCDGRSNSFIRCRSEGDASIKNVCFDSNSVNNLWMGGCWSIFSNITDNGTGNRIEAEGGIILNGSDAVYSGKDANDVLVVAGGDGLDITSGNAGGGSDILLTAGDGGDSTSNNGGVGGDIELTPGQGGSGSPAGSDGNIIMVKNGGYVGIGTTSPSAELDVDGDVTVDTGSVTVTGTDGSTGADATDVLVVAGGEGGYAAAATGGKGADILLTSGIGGDGQDTGNGGDITLTTGAAGDEPGMGGGGDGGDIELTTGQGGPQGENLGPGDGGDIELTPGQGGSGTPASSYGNIIMVKNGGNVGIGTTSPSKLLDVNGDADVGGTLTMDKLVLPVKTTTGDPASPVAGQIYVNTFDNKVRVYADGAWRDLATW